MKRWGLAAAMVLAACGCGPSAAEVAQAERAREAEIARAAESLRAKITAEVTEQLTKGKEAEATKNVEKDNATEASLDTEAAAPEEPMSEDRPTSPEWFRDAMIRREAWINEQQEHLSAADLESLRSDLAKWPALDCKNLKTGDVGEFPQFPVGEIPQSTKDMLLRNARLIREDKDADDDFDALLGFLGIPEYTIAREHNVRIFQILGSDDALAQPLDFANGKVPYAQRGNFRLKGVSLQGIDDPDRTDDLVTVKLSGIFAVSGTVTYVSVRGSDITVPVVEPMSIGLLRAFAMALDK